ncbi:DUF2218 domain-containing protein [Hyphomicrobium sp.]|uniref:DUF2218 domain-containing protein n=1 Tax=Hyphomicrobium sp. TaxID=82 RepID=UPI0025B8A145|nr:DUF2218 domain-containing protein [Hyphomicrobium sp.]MCC7251083.1 DUF2218 domain-containing protein [Hyphomicrobium sp.]
MHVVEAHVKSEKASSYLVQLCKHFAHKTPTDYDESRGRVDFQPGLCVLHAVGDQLSLRCEALNESTLLRVKDVVEVHLVRFAWREKIALTWTEGVPARPIP